MGEGTSDLDRLGREISSVRRELDTLLGELDRRRHEAMDVPLQLRRHAAGLSLAGLALVGAAAGAAGMAARRRRQRRRLWSQASRVRHAVARMTEHPERVAVQPGIVGKIVAAAASAIAAALVKRLLHHAADRVLQAGGQPPRAAPATVEPIRPIRVRGS